MRKKTIDFNITWGSFGGIGIGSVAETGWIIERITYVGSNENGVFVICDCIHVEDWSE